MYHQVKYAPQSSSTINMMMTNPPVSKQLNIVDLAKYPIDDTNNSTYQILLQSSISQLDDQGFVSLPNFLRADAIHKLTSSILSLEDKGVGFHSSDSHNVFLEEGDDDDVSSSQTSSSIHNPRYIKLNSSKLILNANDIAAHTPGLEDLFTSFEFLDFISFVLQTKLYPSTDPYGRYYANIFHEGDGLNWHMDRSEYSISLILQPAKEGGKFQFAPNSRDAVSTWDNMPLNVQDVSRALKPHSIVVKEPMLASGDMYIFRGQNSLHRVSEITKGTRINLILTFNTEPDVKLNQYTLNKFFGIEDSISSVAMM